MLSLILFAALAVEGPPTTKPKMGPIEKERKMVVDAVFNRDYPVVQGVVLVTAFLFILLNLLAEILYVLINPRLRRA